MDLNFDAGILISYNILTEPFNFMYIESSNSYMGGNEGNYKGVFALYPLILT